MTRKELKSSCPEGYSLNETGPKNMLGITELWRIFEHHSEPDLTRIPQDMVGYYAKRVPKEWGRCLYYKTV